MAGAGFLDFTAGNVLTADQLDTYLMQQSVMVFASAAARDSALAVAKSEGMVAYLLDTNRLTVYSGSTWSTVGPVHGGYTAYTPAITQGVAVSSTNGGSGYQRIGRRISGWVSVAVTSAGTAANRINISAPVTGIAGLPVGVGYVVDASPAAEWHGTVKLDTSGLFAIMGSTGNYIGASITLAAGDTIRINFDYEAAADG